jgi:hypothetical protein
MIELITIGFKCAFPIDPAILEGLIQKIPTLAENGSADMICNIFETGSSKCSSGFVAGKKTYLNASLNSDMSGSLLLDKRKPCNGSRVIPETSSSPDDRKRYDKFEEDENKRMQLIIARVLLPYLSSYMVLNALVDMFLTSGEEGEDSSAIPQHLKPFQCQSLQSSIEAAWYRWARVLFLRQALSYILYMVCIISLEYTTTITWLRASVIAVICNLSMYFALIEVHQFQDKKFRTYMYDFWNMWQILSLVLVLIYVCLNIIDMVKSDSCTTTILSQHEWFPGMVHFFTVINFLYYLRAFQNFSWILYAMKNVAYKTIPFVVILLWILLSACFQLAKVNGAFDSTQPIHMFTETYVTSIFGAFDSAEFCSDPYIEAPRMKLALFFILTLIFMILTNAMIAFISEEFANMMDYQKAILVRERAVLIVDLYNSMSREGRWIIAEKYKWAYKLVKQTDLNKMESGDTESDAAGRRATKQDVQSVVAKVRKENAELKTNVELIKKENAEIKSSLERMEKESKATLDTIISLVSSIGTS